MRPRRGRHPHRHPLLRQAHPGRPRPPFPGHRRRLHPPGLPLQRPRPDSGQSHSPPPRSGWRSIPTCAGSRRPAETCGRSWRSSGTGPAGSPYCRATTGSPRRRGRGRRRAHLGDVERGAGRDDGAGPLALAATRPRPGPSRLLPLMDANFLETNPSPVKAGLAAGQDPGRAAAAAGPGRSHHRARSGARSGRGRPLIRGRAPGRARAVPARGDPGRGAGRAGGVLELKAALNAGTVRAAERGPDGNGTPTHGSRPASSSASGWAARTRGDRRALPVLRQGHLPAPPVSVDDGIRIVPGGSAIRDGCYVAPGVVCMPPMYINVGA